nr:DUF2948 family protein [Marinicella sp. W31]MDC2878815.1 DUF2948 family protein [Marinicella sp. W31]
MSTDQLKLMALDEEDLAIISAHVQDAVFLSRDVTFSRVAGQFQLLCNRFVWEKKRGFFKSQSGDGRRWFSSGSMRCAASGLTAKRMTRFPTCFRCNSKKR